MQLKCSLFPQVLHWCPIEIPSLLDYMRQNRGTWPYLLTTQLNGVPYGGYMEDRRKVFDTRHIPSAYYHLGIDFWLPETTPVVWPFETGVLLSATPASSELGGWGGRVDILFDNLVFMFGHLESTSMLEASPLKNQIIGKLGSRAENGGWQPHLHLQCMTYDHYKNYSNPRAIDAYAPPSDNLTKQYPNPFPYVFATHSF
jgi:hypothetical protein